MLKSKLLVFALAAALSTSSTALAAKKKHHSKTTKQETKQETKHEETSTSTTTNASAEAKTSTGDPEKGKEVFQQCSVCHNADSTEKKMGPGLKGLFTWEKMSNEKKPTEENVRAKIDEGGNGMPAYKEMLSEDEKNNLVAYLKTL